MQVNEQKEINDRERKKLKERMKQYGVRQEEVDVQTIMYLKKFVETFETAEKLNDAVGHFGYGKINKKSANLHELRNRGIIDKYGQWIEIPGATCDPRVRQFSNAAGMQCDQGIALILGSANYRQVWQSVNLIG